MKYVLKILQILLLLFLIFSETQDHYFFTDLGVQGRVVSVLVSFLIFLLSLNLGISLLSGIYRRRKNLPQGQLDNVLVGLNNIFYILLGGGLVMTILGIFGIDYRTLFTSLSIVAAAIAIISKDFLAEIISGIIISFSTEVSIGDYVKIGEQKGKIVDITLTKVALLNEDDDIIFIPNSKVFLSEIINYTKKQIKKVSIDFEMNVGLIETVEELEHDLINCLSDFHEQIEAGSYTLKVVDIKKDHLTLKFQYMLRRIDRVLEREIRKTTVRRVVDFINTQQNENKAAAG